MDMYTLDRSLEILLVEDNPGDVRLTIEALKEEGIYNDLHVVRDGVEALEFLYRQGQYHDAVRPDLILLDLNLPKKDGREVLAEIKADADLGSIPVVILSTSDSAEDILKAYQLHANCYITKPVELDDFFTAVQAIARFWFKTVQMPPRI
jgi:two-component system response regulator